ncbi:MAG TPA: Trp biosynthesis-associated membrane protein [Protaetiibacter sp.]|nr:Trp biosynthesis-associated membrane protein [Protaetiibacter sp.]
MTPARLRGGLLAATALAAALVFLAWSQPWFDLALVVAGGDPTPLEVRGDVAASALAPLALAILAVVAALALAGRGFRMVFGVLEALLGVCVILVTVVSLGDPARASAHAVTELTGVTGSESIAALVEGAAVTAWPTLAIVAGALVIVVGVLVTITAPRWPVSGRRFTRTRATRIEGDVETAPGSDAIAEWDALSEGDDPTAGAR